MTEPRERGRVRGHKLPKLPWGGLQAPDTRDERWQCGCVWELGVEIAVTAQRSRSLCLLNVMSVQAVSGSEWLSHPCKLFLQLSKVGRLAGLVACSQPALLVKMHLI
jgi:hypothetical protein